MKSQNGVYKMDSVFHYCTTVSRQVEPGQNRSAVRAATARMFPYTLDGGLPVKKIRF